MNRLLVVLICLALAPIFASAQGDVRNKLAATAAATVTYDSNTGLFTYTYVLTSGPQSLQEIESFYVPLRGTTVVNLRAPAGWIALLKATDDGMVVWCACAPEGIVVPPDFVDYGQLVPSIYQVKPGQSLGGFSFQSPDPPTTGTFYAAGFAQLPMEGVDFPPGMSPDVPTFPNDVFAGQSYSPLRVESTFLGGRRPAVDAFVTFLTLKDGDSKVAPVLVDIVFGPNGGTVYADTFRAALNGVDITGQFLATSSTRRRAYLQLGSGSALKSGVNVLITSVDGMVPGATRTATDTDRLKFLIQ